MGPFKKRQLSRSLAAGLFIAWAVPAGAQPAPAPTPATPPQATQDPAAHLDELFAELKQPGRADWEKVAGEITRIWSQSGSPAMDLLLQQGNAALEAEDYPGAVERLSALIDHAPDFAEGWNARATAYYLMGEYGLSMADVGHVLALNPRHFGALAGLGFMLDSMGDEKTALKALQAAQALNPNQPAVGDAVKRLEKATGGAEL